jgi:hypothetical protein
VLAFGADAMPGSERNQKVAEWPEKTARIIPLFTHLGCAKISIRQRTIPELAELGVGGSTMLAASSSRTR